MTARQVQQARQVCRDLPAQGLLALLVLPDLRAQLVLQEQLVLQAMRGLRAPRVLRGLLARLALLVRKDLRGRQEGMVRLVRRGGQVLLEYRVRRDPPGLLGLLDLPVLQVLREQRALKAQLEAQVRQARQDRLVMMAELDRLGLQVL